MGDVKENLEAAKQKAAAARARNAVADQIAATALNREKVKQAISGGGASGRKLDKIIKVEGNGTGPSLIATLFSAVKETFKKKPKAPKPDAKPAGTKPPVEGVVRYDYSAYTPPSKPAETEKEWPPLSPDLLEQISFKLMRSEPVAGQEAQGPQAVLWARIHKSTGEGDIEDIEQSLEKYKASRVEIDDERFHKTAYQISGDAPVAALLNQYKPKYTKVPGLQESKGLKDRIQIQKDAQSMS